MTEARLKVNIISKLWDSKATTDFLGGFPVGGNIEEKNQYFSNYYNVHSGGTDANKTADETRNVLYNGLKAEFDAFEAYFNENGFDEERDVPTFRDRFISKSAVCLGCRVSDVERVSKYVNSPLGGLFREKISFGEMENEDRQPETVMKKPHIAKENERVL